MRVGTWNLDRPTKRRLGRNSERIALLASFDADIWILTETDRQFEIPDFKHSVHTDPAQLSADSATEACASIHSRWPLNAIAFQPFDPCIAVCASVETPFGPAVVYASIITYHFDGVLEGRAPWELHQASCISHGKDWAALREAHPDHALVVGGDWNQALDGAGRYRHPKSTQLLQSALSAAGLSLLTGEDYVKSGKLRSRHNVDHLAVAGKRLEQCTPEAHPFEGEFEGTPLSDHNGVIVCLG